MEDTTNIQFDMPENPIDSDNLTDFDIFAQSLPIFLYTLRQPLIISPGEQKPLDDDQGPK